MKTKYFFLAAAAALFAACSSDDGIVQQEQAKQQAAEQVPVTFDGYVNRGTTRAGLGGVMSDGALKTSQGGFGVFAYYTDNQPYGETAKPDFMYNQKVKWDGTSAWTYSPIKYWPNEFGTGAESAGQDMLSFFAYAPYVEVIPTSGRIAGNEKLGIVGMSSNTASGDPYVKYYVDFNPATSVDLCWGVVPSDANYTSSVVSGLNNIGSGKPYIDVLKPQIQSTEAKKIKFNFNHALASLNVQIDADVDIAPNSETHVAVDKNTRIWVRSVTFEGFTDKGSLNLNSNTTQGPQWFELTSTNTPIGPDMVTIHDGLLDNKEGQASSTVSNERTGLYTKLTQGGPYAEWTEGNGLYVSDDYTGVTKDAVNLFNNGTATAPVFVIPNGQELKVTIVYDVETYDANLAGYLSDGVKKGKSVENKITKTICTNPADATTAIKMAAGKKYTVNLHLGMTSVQFDAKVENWGTGADADVDLPINAN